jgi:hypothetical protein
MKSGRSGQHGGRERFVHGDSFSHTDERPVKVDDFGEVLEGDENDEGGTRKREFGAVGAGIANEPDVR